MLILAPIVFLAQTTGAAQKEINFGYLRWDKAVVAHDRKAMESLLARSFVAKIKGTKKTMNKEEFIGAISGRWRVKNAPQEKSFKTKVNIVTIDKGIYLANIDESVVFAMSGGKTKKIDFKSLDTWMKVGKKWLIVATEPAD